MTALYYKISEVAELLDIHISMAKRLVRSGEIHSIKIGRSRRVPVTAFEEYRDGPFAEYLALRDTRYYYKASDVAERLNLSVGMVKKLIQSGEIHSVKRGSSRLVPVDSFEEYRAWLESSSLEKAS